MAVNVGYGPVSAEGGDIFLVDLKAGRVHAYNYGGFGLGWSFPPGISFAASAEIGAVSGIDSRDEFTGWGYAISGFIAAGPEGVAGQYFSNLSGDYRGLSAGWAAGLGANISGVGTYTRFDRWFSIEELPQEIKDLIDEFLGGCQPGGQ